MPKRVLMLAGDFVEDLEVYVPFQSLLSVGVLVDVVCPGKKSGETIAAAVHDFVPEHQTYLERRGHNFTLNKTFTEVKLEEYDALYIPGGRMAEYIRLDEKVCEIVRHFFHKNLPVACICHGAQILVAAEVCKGRKLTCYPACSPDVRIAGGTYVEVAPTEAVLDGNLVTSPAWPGHPELLKQFYALLGLKIVTA